MAQIESHFTVFIRLPFNRGDFVDPSPVSWSTAKERHLWDVISRQSRGNDIDWNGLAERLEATPQFLLQQAAWLYERQLLQVRAQMRKVNIRPSATPSPAPSSIAGSQLGGHAMKRGASGGSEAPTRINTQVKAATAPSREGSTPSTPAKSKNTLPLRAASGLLSSQLRPVAATSGPMSRQSSKDQASTNVYSRRGSVQHQLPRSPTQNRTVADDSSESDTTSTKITASKIVGRRTNPSATPRRPVAGRREKEARRPSLASDHEDDEDSPPFLPFAGSSTTRRQSSSQQDPSATLRGGFVSSQLKRPTNPRKTTSERIVTTTATQGPARTAPLISPTSSTSSGPTPTTTQGPTSVPMQPLLRAARVLSPRQQAALAQLSPRHRAGTGRTGSDTSPSLGSSFSDLDDASVTQSALEEALMSNMARGNSNASSNGGTGIASRVI